MLSASRICRSQRCDGYNHLKFRHLLYGLNGWTVAREVMDAAVIALLRYVIRMDQKRAAGEYDDDIEAATDI